MTTAKEGAELTQTGPGTMMGQLMRQYWIPAALSSELERDGAPLRLMILGEKLIAFRDSSGRVGIMDHRCPHRCASLFLGRNEANGIRCVYHGWKFDVEGRCVDMPNLLPHQDFKHKVRAKAYPAVERAGLVWVYMGASAVPQLPELEVLLLPDDELGVSCIQRDCNYLQALEGDIDTSHFGFLHAGHVDADDVPEDHPIRHAVTNRAPEYQVTETPWGTQYAAYRPVGAGRMSWLFANFLFPFWTQQPQGEFVKHVHVRAWVPLDDTHTMFYYLWWKRGTSSVARPRPPLKDGKRMGGDQPEAEFLPNTTGWLGRWRLVENEHNEWLIDREAQRGNDIYTGIGNIHLQDQAVTESMGPITGHRFEHLAPSDQMIMHTRRRLLMSARALHESGTLPQASRARKCSGTRAAVTARQRARCRGRNFMPASLPYQYVRPLSNSL